MQEQSKAQPMPNKQTSDTIPRIREPGLGFLPSLSDVRESLDMHSEVLVGPQHVLQSKQPRLQTFRPRRDPLPSEYFNDDLVLEDAPNKNIPDLTNFTDDHEMLKDK